MFIHYLKVALRNLFRNKVQHAISILGIAVGFTAFLLGGYWYYWEHSFDTFHPDSEHTYTITTSGLLYKNINGVDGELRQLHESVEKEILAFPEIKGISRVSELAYQAEGKEKAWMGMKVDSLYFSLFQCKLIEGSYKQVPFNDESIIITQKMATYLFADSTCIGKRVKVSKQKRFTVVGVMKDYPQNSDFKFDYLCLSAPQPNSQNRYITYIQVYPGSDIEALSRKIASLRMKKEDTEWSAYSQWRFHLRTMAEAHITCSPELDARFRNIQILAAAGLLAFVSSLMNLLVLFIGQQQRKARYNATFATMGASLRSLVGKNLIELVLPLLAAFLLSMALVEFIFPFYQEYTQLMPDSNSFYLGFVQRITSGEVVRMALLIYPLAAVAFLLLSIFPILALLKRSRHTTSQTLRNGLIAGQIFIGSLFLITSLSFYLQYRLMTDTDKGLVTDRIWQIDLGFDATCSTDCTPFREELKRSTSIEEVTALVQPLLISQAEYYCTYISKLPIEGRNMEEAGQDNNFVVQKNFLSFFGMKMKEGEWISNEGTYDIVVNESGAKELNIPSLTGRPILVNHESTDQKPYRISGVMADYHYCPMQFRLSKVFFLYKDNAEAVKNYMGFRYFYIKVRPGSEQQALDYAAKAYRKYDKGEVSEDQQIVSLTALMDQFNRPERVMFSIFLLLALLCILISSYGIYGLVALSAEQRKKEIAIRKVNGALFHHILRLFLKEYIWLALIGNAVALPLGYVFIQRWLETYAYHVPFQAWLLPLVFIITCSIVVLSVTRQVLLATKANPVDAIKD